MELEVISRLPAGEPRPTPLLFVHGAWHGAWCWDDHFLPYFAEHGYAAHALSLRGHGKSPGRERLRWTRLLEYVEDVAQVAATLPAPPVIIGHSMGGGVTQRYLEKYPAKGGILLAALPPHGAWGATWRTLRRQPLDFMLVNLKLSLYPLLRTLDRARHALFSHDAPAGCVGDCFERLQDESYVAYLDMLLFARPRPKRVNKPALVLGAEKDALFGPNEVRATARAYGTEAIIFPNMAHDMMLEEGWEEVAGRMLAWLQAQGW